VPADAAFKTGGLNFFSGYLLVNSIQSHTSYCLVGREGKGDTFVPAPAAILHVFIMFVSLVIEKYYCLLQP